MAMLLAFLLFSPGAAVRSSLDLKEASRQALSVGSGGRVDLAAMEDFSYTAEKHVEDKNYTDSFNPVYRCDSPIYAIQKATKTSGRQLNRPLYVSGPNNNVAVHDNMLSDFELYSNNDQKCKNARGETDARRTGYRSSWSIRWREDPSRMQEDGVKIPVDGVKIPVDGVKIPVDGVKIPSEGNWVTEEREVASSSNRNRQSNVAASSASPQEYCIYYCGLRGNAPTNTRLSEADLWLQNTHVRSFHIETLTPRSARASNNALPSWRVKRSSPTMSPADSNIITESPRRVCPPGSAFKFLLPRINKHTAREFGCTEPGSGCA